MTEKNQAIIDAVQAILASRAGGGDFPDDGPTGFPPFGGDIDFPIDPRLQKPETKGGKGSKGQQFDIDDPEGLLKGDGEDVDNGPDEKQGGSNGHEGKEGQEEQPGQDGQEGQGGQEGEDGKSEQPGQEGQEGKELTQGQDIGGQEKTDVEKQMRDDYVKGYNASKKAFKGLTISEIDDAIRKIKSGEIKSL